MQQHDEQTEKKQEIKEILGEERELAEHNEKLKNQNAESSSSSWQVPQLFKMIPLACNRSRNTCNVTRFTSRRHDRPLCTIATANFWKPVEKWDSSEGGHSGNEPPR
ncbi:hypothetical protein K0M31_007164 [Melipona bicolor]|uniref:Uncharacterized protein n=1 Tax=Melipona bicolor TaxID=60889 RepID=A0AA40FRQ8_9HYME|nr:hypothetical protein K0M31_007164 [Melipona bicolor]